MKLVALHTGEGQDKNVMTLKDGSWRSPQMAAELNERAKAAIPPSCQTAGFQTIRKN